MAKNPTFRELAQSYINVLDALEAKREDIYVNPDDKIVLNLLLLDGSPNIISEESWRDDYNEERKKEIAARFPNLIEVDENKLAIWEAPGRIKLKIDRANLDKPTTLETARLQELFTNGDGFKPNIQLNRKRDVLKNEYYKGQEWVKVKSFTEFPIIPYAKQKGLNELLVVQIDPAYHAELTAILANFSADPTVGNLYQKLFHLFGVVKSDQSSLQEYLNPTLEKSILAFSAEELAADLRKIALFSVIANYVNLKDYSATKINDRGEERSVLEALDYYFTAPLGAPADKTIANLNSVLTKLTLPSINPLTTNANLLAGLKEGLLGLNIRNKEMIPSIFAFNIDLDQLIIDPNSPSEIKEFRHILMSLMDNRNTTYKSINSVLESVGLPKFEDVNESDALGMFGWQKVINRQLNIYIIARLTIDANKLIEHPLLPGTSQPANKILLDLIDQETTTVEQVNQFWKNLGNTQDLLPAKNFDAAKKLQFGDWINIAKSLSRLTLNDQKKVINLLAERADLNENYPDPTTKQTRRQYLQDLLANGQANYGQIQQFLGQIGLQYRAEWISNANFLQPLHRSFAEQLEQNLSKISFNAREQVNEILFGKQPNPLVNRHVDPDVPYRPYQPAAGQNPALIPAPVAGATNQKVLNDLLANPNTTPAQMNEFLKQVGLPNIIIADIAKVAEELPGKVPLISLAERNNIEKIFFGYEENGVIVGRHIDPNATVVPNTETNLVSLRKLLLSRNTTLANIKPFIDQIPDLLETTKKQFENSSQIEDGLELKISTLLPIYTKEEQQKILQNAEAHHPDDSNKASDLGKLKQRLATSSLLTIEEMKNLLGGIQVIPGTKTTLLSRNIEKWQWPDLTDAQRYAMLTALTPHLKDKASVEELARLLRQTFPQKATIEIVNSFLAEHGLSVPTAAGATTFEAIEVLPGTGELKPISTDFAERLPKLNYALRQEVTELLVARVAPSDRPAFTNKLMRLLVKPKITREDLNDLLKNYESFGIQALSEGTDLTNLGTWKNIVPALTYEQQAELKKLLLEDGYYLDPNATYIDAEKYDAALQRVLTSHDTSIKDINLLLISAGLETIIIIARLSGIDFSDSPSLSYINTLRTKQPQLKIAERNHIKEQIAEHLELTGEIETKLNAILSLPAGEDLVLAINDFLVEKRISRNTIPAITASEIAKENFLRDNALPLLNLSQLQEILIFIGDRLPAGITLDTAVKDSVIAEKFDAVLDKLFEVVSANLEDTDTVKDVLQAILIHSDTTYKDLSDLLLSLEVIRTSLEIANPDLDLEEVIDPDKVYDVIFNASAAMTDEQVAKIIAALSQQEKIKKLLEQNTEAGKSFNDTLKDYLIDPQLTYEDLQFFFLDVIGFSVFPENNINIHDDPKEFQDYLNQQIALNQIFAYLPGESEATLPRDKSTKLTELATAFSKSANPDYITVGTINKFLRELGFAESNSLAGDEHEQINPEYLPLLLANVLPFVAYEQRQSLVASLAGANDSNIDTRKTNLNQFLMQRPALSLAEFKAKLTQKEQQLLSDNHSLLVDLAKNLPYLDQEIRVAVYAILEVDLPSITDKLALKAALENPMLRTVKDFQEKIINKFPISANSRIRALMVENKGIKTNIYNLFAPELPGENREEFWNKINVMTEFKDADISLLFSSNEFPVPTQNLRDEVRNLNQILKQITPRFTSKQIEKIIAAHGSSLADNQKSFLRKKLSEQMRAEDFRAGADPTKPEDVVEFKILDTATEIEQKVNQWISFIARSLAVDPAQRRQQVINVLKKYYDIAANGERLWNKFLTSLNWPMKGEDFIQKLKDFKRAEVGAGSDQMLLYVDGSEAENIIDPTADIDSLATLVKEVLKRAPKVPMDIVRIFVNAFQDLFGDQVNTAQIAILQAVLTHYPNFPWDRGDIAKIFKETNKLLSSPVNRQESYPEIAARFPAEEFKPISIAEITLEVPSTIHSSIVPQRIITSIDVANAIASFGSGISVEQIKELRSRLLHFATAEKTEEFITQLRAAKNIPYIDSEHSISEAHLIKLFEKARIDFSSNLFNDTGHAKRTGTRQERWFTHQQLRELFEKPELKNRLLAETIVEAINNAANVPDSRIKPGGRAVLTLVQSIIAAGAYSLNDSDSIKRLVQTIDCFNSAYPFELLDRFVDEKVNSSGVTSKEIQLDQLKLAIEFHANVKANKAYKLIADLWENKVFGEVNFDKAKQRKLSAALLTADFDTAEGLNQILAALDDNYTSIRIPNSVGMTMKNLLDDSEGADLKKFNEDKCILKLYSPTLSKIAREEFYSNTFPIMKRGVTAKGIQQVMQVISRSQDVDPSATPTRAILLDSTNGLARSGYKPADLEWNKDTALRIAQQSGLYVKSGLEQRLKDFYTLGGGAAFASYGGENEAQFKARTIGLAGVHAFLHAEFTSRGLNFNLTREMLNASNRETAQLGEQNITLNIDANGEITTVLASTLSSRVAANIDKPNYAIQSVSATVVPESGGAAQEKVLFAAKTSTTPTIIEKNETTVKETLDKAEAVTYKTKSDGTVKVFLKDNATVQRKKGQVELSDFKYDIVTKEVNLEDVHSRLLCLLEAGFKAIKLEGLPPEKQKIIYAVARYINQPDDKVPPSEKIIIIPNVLSDLAKQREAMHLYEHMKQHVKMNTTPGVAELVESGIRLRA